MPGTNPELLTTVEVAKTLKVSRATVYHLMQRGELKSVHLGSRRLIRRSDLDSFIANLEEAL
jgi:excisionase family DNA binding protein